MLIQDSPLLPNDTTGLENRTVVVTTIMVRAQCPCVHVHVHSFTRLFCQVPSVTFSTWIVLELTLSTQLFHSIPPALASMFPRSG